MSIGVFLAQFTEHFREWAQRGAMGKTSTVICFIHFTLH